MEVVSAAWVLYCHLMRLHMPPFKEHYKTHKTKTTLVSQAILFAYVTVGQPEHALSACVIAGQPALFAFIISKPA